MSDDDDPLLPRRFGLEKMIACASVLVVGGGMAQMVLRDDGPRSLGIEPAAYKDLDELHDFMEPPAPEEASSGASTRHRGEEGKMGRPSARGNDDDANVWGGGSNSEIGEAYGVGGLGLVGSGRGGGGTGEGTIGLGDVGLIGKGGGGGTGQGYGGRGRTARAHVDVGGVRIDWDRDEPTDRERYAAIAENGFVAIGDDAKSTFSIDVDTASYSNVRRFLDEGQLPPADAVRIEEMINYFDYDDDPPADAVPFAVHSEVATCPWADDHLLVRLGLQGQMFNDEDLPTRNFVFLVDVSGSMESRLPLLQQSLGLLVDNLRPHDRVGIVVYAGASGIVLDPTTGDAKKKIRTAIERLRSGGSTNGGAGIELAYRLAERHFVEGGANRVILATDGDFNVGVASKDALERLIERKRESGVFLSVLGFGRGNLQDAKLEALADRGNGNYAYIDTIDEARKVLVDEAAATLVTIAKDVKIQVELDPAEVESWRLVGYENRKLAHQDFTDDRKDAGEIGAGHDVTALYEIVPRAGWRERGGTLMQVALRYKQPDGNTSTPVQHAVGGDARSLAAASDDLRFAAAVAQLGMLLRASPHRGSATWSSTWSLAEAARGDDPKCERAELVELVAQAATLSGADTPRPRTVCKS